MHIAEITENGAVTQYKVSLHVAEFDTIAWALENAVDDLHDCSHEIDNGEALYERMKNIWGEWG